MEGFVYLIRCPDSKNVVYIGETTNTIGRYSDHCNGYSKVSLWAKSIRPKKPIMDIIYKGDYLSATILEPKIIKYYRSLNYALFNIIHY